MYERVKKTIFFSNFKKGAKCSHCNFDFMNKIEGRCNTVSPLYLHNTVSPLYLHNTVSPLYIHDYQLSYLNNTRVPIFLNFFLFYFIPIDLFIFLFFFFFFFVPDLSEKGEMWNVHLIWLIFLLLLFFITIIIHYYYTYCTCNYHHCFN